MAIDFSQLFPSQNQQGGGLAGGFQMGQQIQNQRVARQQAQLKIQQSQRVQAVFGKLA